MAEEYARNAWQRICTGELIRCAEMRGSQRRRRRAWNLARLFLSQGLCVPTPHGHQTTSRIIIADANLSGLNLSGFNLRRCYFVRSDLTAVKLVRSNLYQAIFRETNLTRSDLSGANLSKCSINDSCSGVSDFIYDSRTKFFGLNAKEMPFGTSQRIINRIHADERRYNGRGEKKSAPLKLWLWMTNYGRDLWPIFIIVTLAYVAGALIHAGFMSDWSADWREWADNAIPAMFLSSDAMLGIDASQQISSMMWKAAFHAQAAASFVILAILIASITFKVMGHAQDA